MNDIIYAKNVFNAGIETALNNALEIMLHLLSQLHSQRSFVHSPHPQQRHQSASIGDNPPFQFG
jgi:hypothetical protein